MPSLNQAEFLPQAIESVLGQGYADIELIVSDGGSTDGTLDILASFAARDPRLRWRSERDSGPAEALNRAIARVRGTLIGWLNADDLYARGAIERAVEALADRPRSIMVYGHGEHVDKAGELIARYPTLRPEGPIERFADGCFICQPTVFFRRTLPLLLGPLDETLTASFDFDYWLRAFQAFPGRIAFIDAVQARSRLHPGGITARQRRAVAIEGIRIIAKAFGTAPVHWLTTYMEEMKSAAISNGLVSKDQLLAELDLFQPNIEPADFVALCDALKRE